MTRYRLDPAVPDDLRETVQEMLDKLLIYESSRFDVETICDLDSIEYHMRRICRDERKLDRRTEC